ncbi:MAG: hypothetical protein LGB00_01140, partial [Sulfurovum sp.]|nr:hypothetical protein [Sulfurovum sp.]
TLSALMDSQTKNKIKSNSGGRAFQHLEEFIANNADKVPPEITDTVNLMKTNLQNQAQFIIDSGGTDITYNNVRSQLNQAGDVNKATSEYTKSKPDPFKAVDSAKHIGQQEYSTPPGLIQRLFTQLYDIDMPSEAETKMRKYDNETLNAVIKEAKKTLKSSTISAEKGKSDRQTKAEELINIANKIKTARKKVKKTYTTKESKSSTNNTTQDSATIDPKKVRKVFTKVGRSLFSTIKDTTNSTITPVLNKLGKLIDSKMTEEERKFVNNLINKAVKTGKLSKEMAQPYLDKLVSTAKSVKDSKLVNKTVDTYNDLATKVNNTSVKDIRVKIKKAKLKVKDSKIFNEIVKNYNDLASNINSLSKEDVDNKVNDIKTKIKKAKDTVKESELTNEIINDLNKLITKVNDLSIKDVKDKVKSIKEAELTKEVIDDFKTLGKTSKAEAEKILSKLQKTYKDIDFLDVYTEFKDMLNDLVVKGKKVKERNSVPDTDINMDEGC